MSEGKRRGEVLFVLSVVIFVVVGGLILVQSWLCVIHTGFKTLSGRIWIFSVEWCIKYGRLMSVIQRIALFDVLERENTVEVVEV